jgi:hypothetical protein
MARTRAIGMICVVAACLGAVLGWAFRRPAHSVHGDEVIVRLSIPPDALNLGTIWENEDFMWTAPIENREAEPIEVKSFGKTCNCLSIEPQSFVIRPGERRELRLHIDLISQTKPTGEVAVRLWPQLRANSGTELAKHRAPEWTVSGQVRRALALDRSVYLGRHSELAQPLLARTIPIEVLVPLESLSAQCDVPGFTASVELPQGKDKTVLRLTPPSYLSVGAFQGTIRLKPVLKGGEALPAREIRFSGKIVPDVEVVPPVVQVGGRGLGETFEELVVLRSIAGRMLAAVRAETEGEGLSVEAIEGGGSYRIRQRVCGVGLQTNRVHFHTESDGRPVAIVVPVSYTGLESSRFHPDP